MNDRAILLGCREGDPDAAAALMARHQPLLFRVVLRLVRRRPVAEEIVQETFLRTFAAIGRIDPEQGARGWLVRVATNLARNHLAKEAHADLEPWTAEAASALFAVPEDDPERAFLAGEQRVRLERALSELSPKLREIVLLRYMEGLPYPEIARALRLPIPALKMRAFRARARLLDLLQREAAP